MLPSGDAEELVLPHFPLNALARDRGVFRRLIGRVEFCLNTDRAYLCGVLTDRWGLEKLVCYVRERMYSDEDSAATHSQRNVKRK